MLGPIIPVIDRIDSLLARQGSFHSVQKFRYHTFHLYQKKDDISPDVMQTLCENIICIEATLRFLAQREEDLRERYSALEQKSSTQEDKKQLSKWLKWLDEMPKRYWVLERKLYKQGAVLPRGGLLRAYKLWRSNPRWYLHPDLVNDCAGRGGCCGHSCGCCERRRHAVDRRRSAGHCSEACGCCIRNRGFELRDLKIDLKIDLKDLSIYRSALDQQTKGTRTRRLVWANFFGIGSGVDAAPRWT